MQQVLGRVQQSSSAHQTEIESLIDVMVALSDALATGLRLLCMEGGDQRRLVGGNGAGAQAAASVSLLSNLIVCILQATRSDDAQHTRRLLPSTWCAGAGLELCVHVHVHAPGKHHGNLPCPDASMHGRDGVLPLIQIPKVGACNVYLCTSKMSPPLTPVCVS